MQPILEDGRGVLRSRLCETGQLLIDRVKHADVLEYLWWINSHSIYMFKLMYGDKDTFPLAFAVAGKAYDFIQMPIPPGAALALKTSQGDIPPWHSWLLKGQTQYDHLGRIMFLHQTLNKRKDALRLPHHIDAVSGPVPDDIDFWGNHTWQVEGDMVRVFTLNPATPSQQQALQPASIGVGNCTIAAAEYLHVHSLGLPAMLPASSSVGSCSALDKVIDQKKRVVQLALGQGAGKGESDWDFLLAPDWASYTAWRKPGDVKLPALHLDFVGGKNPQSVLDLMQNQWVPAAIQWLQSHIKDMPLLSDENK